jgi:hypothetical protein
MRSTAFIIVMLFVAMAGGVSVHAQPPALKEFNVYTDDPAPDNHFYPSGWFGDWGDIKIDTKHADNPHSKKTCIEIVYSAQKAQNTGWAGIFWQNPANNWGAVPSGYDLRGMTKLTFWARGARGGEVIEHFMVGGIKGAVTDSMATQIGPIELTDQWQQYTINLAGRDMSSIIGGFGWATTPNLNPEGATFYLDDIKFEEDPEMKPKGKMPEAMPFFVYDDANSKNNHYTLSGWMGNAYTLDIDDKSTVRPHGGKTCMKFTYGQTINNRNASWVGVYWLNPANNWGFQDGGYNLSKATKLTFWARGEKGGEKLHRVVVGGIRGKYSDTTKAKKGPIELTTEWKQYTVSLKHKNVSYISSGFAWTTNVDLNPHGATFYLDDIKFE